MQAASMSIDRGNGNGNVSCPLPGMGDVVVGDWDLLFDAVTTRLRHTAVEARFAFDAPHDAVLDCVQALEQLHASLGQERQRGKRLEQELRHAQAVLALTRFELVGTQVGERRARHQAEHDGLTSLPNSSSFRARLDDALSPGDQRAPTLAVLYLDLDGFKPINDRHGHATGDELLRIVAHRLARSVRADDMVCRLGGDEFACLLSDPMGRQQLSQLASKLFDAVSAPLKVGSLELTVRPSIGIAVCPTDGDTSATLLKRADAAMYRAKRSQMGFAFFDRHSDD
jgi:diguanylate cyclase (GGDEF)-like protein